jgi:hypothetical protein
MQKTMTVLIFFLLLVACQKVDIKIVPIGDKQVGVGQTLVFDVCVTGAGSETVTFTFEAPSLPSSGAQLTPYQNDCATFRWTPRSEQSVVHLPGRRRRFQRYGNHCHRGDGVFVGPGLSPARSRRDL